MLDWRTLKIHFQDSSVNHRLIPSIKNFCAFCETFYSHCCCNIICEICEICVPLKYFCDLTFPLRAVELNLLRFLRDLLNPRGCYNIICAFCAFCVTLCPPARHATKIFCTKMGYIKIILYLCSQLSVLVDARVSSLRKLWLITLRNSSTRAVLAFRPWRCGRHVEN